MSIKLSPRFLTFTEHWFRPGVLIGGVVLLLCERYFALAQGDFWPPNEQFQYFLSDSLERSAPYFFVALGSAFVLNLRRVDLTPPATMALIAAVMLRVDGYELGIMHGVLGVVVIAISVQSLQWILIEKARVNFIIVTLGLNIFFLAIAKMEYSNLYAELKTKAVSFPRMIDGQLPVFVLVALIVWILGSFLVHGSRPGLVLRGIGVDPDQAERLGAQAPVYSLAAYLVAGLAYACAMLASIARYQAAEPAFGEGLDLVGIAIAVLAGASIGGGKLPILTVPVAALLYALLEVRAPQLNWGGELGHKLVLAGLLIVISAIDAGIVFWLRKRSRSELISWGSNA